MRFPRILRQGALVRYAHLPLFLHAGYIILSRLYSTLQSSGAPTTNEELTLKLTQAIELSPQNPDLYLRRAHLYFEKRKFELSEKDVDSTIKLSNDIRASHAWILKSRIYTSRGDWETSRRLLTEDPHRFSALGTPILDIVRLIDDLENQWNEAEYAESLRDYAKCHNISRNLVNWSPHSRAILRLHASCALEIFRVEGTRECLAILTELSDATVDDFLAVARFVYFFAESDDYKSSLGFLRDCLKRFPKSSKCLSLAKRIKKFNSSFVGLAEMLESGDWRGLVTHLIHNNANTTSPVGLLPAFDAELSRSVSATSYDVKQLSTRRVLLARLLCNAAENLDLDTVSLNLWCRSLGYRLPPEQPGVRRSVTVAQIDFSSKTTKTRQVLI